jgi:lipopolysaccharide transport system permease protein
MNELIIEPGKTEKQYWRDLWRYRELFAFLVWRDLLVRYKQTVVGVTWSFVRPLITMVILTAVTKVGKLPTGGVPDALFVLSATLPWQLFSTAMSESGNSLVTNSNLISKIYFPRLVIPASSVITAFVDFAISMVFFSGIMLWYGYVPPINCFFLPFFVVAALGASFGIGLWLSALMVRYRDFRIIVPFMVQFGLYASPVLIMTSRVPEKWRLIYSLNPMVGVIDGFRWSLLGGQHLLYLPGLAVSIAAIVVLVLGGISYFRKTERSFADVI